MIDTEMLEKLSAEKVPLIEKELRKVLPAEGLPNLHDAAWYHIGTGGKKLRPLLAIVTYESLTNDRIEKILPFAAACDLLHNWILIHDDIEDGDKVRRDKPAVWIKYGLAHGINIGDYLAQKVYELILNSRSYGVDNEKIFKLISAVVDTTVRTAEGQAMDINLRNNDNPTEKDYLDMVVRKTAHYLTISMIGAAIIAGREELIQKLIEFGRNIGPAFQIADDILDLTEGKGRKELGRDIKEGKRSILIVHCLTKCTGEERARLLSMLNKTAEETTDADVDYVSRLFEKYDSIDYARKKADELIAKAKRIADSLPQKLRDILYFFADYSVQRRK